MSIIALNQLKNNFYTNKLFHLLEEKSSDQEFIDVLNEMIEKKVSYNQKELSHFLVKWIENSGSPEVLKKLIFLGVDLNTEEHGLTIWQMAFFKESIAFAPRLMDIIVMEILQLSKEDLPLINEYIDEAMEKHEALLDSSYEVMLHTGTEPDLFKRNLDNKYNILMQELTKKFNSLIKYT